MLILLLTATPVQAQTRNEKIWNTISWATVSTQVTLDSIHSLKSENKKKEFLQQGIRIGVTSLLTRITKHYVSKERPDHSANDSFFSGHSAQAATAMFWQFPVSKKGYRWSVSIPLTTATMLGRVQAKKHDWVDVLTGAGVGSLVGGLTEYFVK